VLKTSISIASASSHTFAPFTDSFMNAAVQHLSQSLFQFMHITAPLLIDAALLSRSCSYKDPYRGC